MNNQNGKVKLMSNLNIDNLYVTSSLKINKLLVDDLIIEDKSVKDTILDIDNSLFNLETRLNKLDYTAIEVFPTTEAIPAGTEDPDTGLHYVYEVLPSSKCTLRFDSPMKDRLDCDIVVDWGDGNKTIVSDLDDEGVTKYEWITDEKISKVHTTHEYTEVDNKTKYIIKIYGTPILVRCQDGVNKDPCIVSRILDMDLPIGSSVMNISSLAYGSKKLLRVNIPEYYSLKNVKNITSMCATCVNLIEFKISKLADVSKHYSATDSIFSGCNNLTADINEFNTLMLFGNTRSRYYQIFNSCPKLYGTINSRLYWDRDPIIPFTETKACFSACSKDIRSQVPVSWGGTKAE